MRRILNSASTAAIASVLAVGAATAQEGLRDAQANDEVRSDWVLGSTVRSPDDEVIGTINGILIDADDGNVTAVVIDVGGFLGFGAKPIAVDWDELDLQYDASLVQLDLTREQAEDAAEFSFREQETPPPPEAPAGTGTGTGGTGDGMGGGGTGTGDGMGGTGAGDGMGTGTGMNDQGG